MAKYSSTNASRNLDTSKGEMTFYTPHADLWKKCAMTLESSYVPSLLADWRKALIQLVSGYRIHEIDHKGKEVDQPYLTQQMLAAKIISREYATLIAFFLSEPRNLKVWTDTMPKEYLQVIPLCIQQHYVSVKTLQKKFPKVKWTQEDKYYTYGVSNVEAPWLDFGSEQYMYRYDNASEHQFFCLDGVLLPYILPLLPPEQQYSNLNTHKELPEESQLKVFNGEKQIFRAIPILQSLFAQNLLEINTEKMKMKVSDVRQAIKLTGMQSVIAPEALDKSDFCSTSAALAIHILTYHMVQYREGSTQEQLKILQKCTANLRKLFSRKSELTFFAPWIKASALGPLRYQTDTHLEEFIKVLFQAPQAWIRIEDIVRWNHMHVNYRSKDTPAALLSLYDLEEVSHTYKLHGEDAPLEAEELMRIGTIGAMKSVCMMLAGLGLVDLAYHDYRPDVDLTPSDPAEYVRLTPLGLYCLQRSKEYEVPQEEHGAYFAIEEDHLIVRSLVKDNPYAPLLSDTATPIGNSRFVMTPESFLEHCSTALDVENKISQFKQFVCPNPPQLWLDFFTSIRQHVNPLQEEDPEDYHIYHIGADNRDLLNLLTSDESLRALIIRAEGYRILIKHSDLRKFTTRLKHFGYLL